ncbi:MAG: hypothetical protein Q4G07_09520 [Oscillospiraceae bacterium]|nr:hypothetical protein [Oscillospiraceae bacterium]
MEINWLAIGIGNIILCVAILLFTIFRFVKVKGFGGQAANGSSNEFDPQLRETLMKSLTQAFVTFNVKAISSITSEMLYYATELTVNALKKVGVRKEIAITPDPASKPISSNVMTEDGKNALTTDIIYGSYEERYIDNATDKILYKRIWPKASYVLNLTKSDLAQQQKEKFCINCGAPIEQHGDFYDCPNCDSHYSAESYHWQIIKMYPQNMKNDSLVGKVICFSLLAFFIISLAAAVWPVLLPVVILANVLLLGSTVTYSVWASKKLAPWKVLTQTDPHFSRTDFEYRAVYLYKLYRHACDFDLSKLRPFIRPEAFEKIKAHNNYDDDFYFLDLENPQTYIENPRVEDGKQIVDIHIKAMVLCRNEKKKLICKKEKLSFSLYRNANTKTTVASGLETITCPQCGANINLSHDGKCAYCGAEYDLANYDWILYDV